ncbi:MAG: aminomethyltransferase family protein, partial [Phycisphaerae bacterium]
VGIIDQLAPFKASDIKRYHFKTGNAMGMEYYVARSGYTGEDGIEAIFPAKVAAAAVQLLISNAADMGKPIKPAGLGARDTLRLEAAMPLYGHELTEEWDSLTAGQAWCVDLTKDFIGAEAMRRVKERGLERQVVGFEVDGKRIARQGASILVGGEQVGVVTSGTHSPTFDKVLGLGLVNASHATPGTAIEVDLRGSKINAKVVATPFYKRAK